MNNNKKIQKNILKLIVGVITVLFLTIGISYAFWVLSLSQSDKNTIGTACLKLTLSGANDAISLQDSYPISDFEGMQTEGYTFTVQNNCNRDIDYRIDLDSLVLDDEDNRLPSSSVDVLLDYGSNFIENNEIPTYADLISVETTDSTLKDKKVLAYDTVLANSTNTHTLRMWIDESSKSEDESKDFEAKISIYAGQGIEKEYTDESCFTFDSSTGTISAYDVSTCGTDVVIPYEIDGNAVTAIGNNIANNKSLTSIEIPRSVKTIGSSSFANNKTLTKIILKDGIESIGVGAFRMNRSTINEENNIHNIIIPKTLTTIGVSSFVGISLQRLIIPDNVTSINTSAFALNDIKELSIGSGVTAIGNTVFEFNHIENLVIPNNITSIGDGTFAGNPLKSIKIGSGVTTLGYKVFYLDTLTRSDFPQTVPSVINIPSNVTNINGSFNGIPSTTNIIFHNCESALTIGTNGNNGGTQSFICETE